jgi:uncharacterized damage-inducible protein DinB
MKKVSQSEVWQRGPIEQVPALLQPVAHALLQAVEDVEEAMENFPPDLLSQTPGGVASVSFHLKHLKGVIDRLFTYARGGMLSEQQLSYLKAETVPGEGDSIRMLVDNFKNQVSVVVEELKTADVNTLTDRRVVGRKQIPSTVIGLWFHAAEHTQRHVGQLIVTTRVLKARRE